MNGQAPSSCLLFHSTALNGSAANGGDLLARDHSLSSCSGNRDTVRKLHGHMNLIYESLSE